MHGAPCPFYLNLIDHQLREKLVPQDREFTITVDTELAQEIELMIKAGPSTNPPHLLKVGQRIFDPSLPDVLIDCHSTHAHSLECCRATRRGLDSED